MVHRTREGSLVYSSTAPARMLSATSGNVDLSPLSESCANVAPTFAFAHTVVHGTHRTAMRARTGSVSIHRQMIRPKADGTREVRSAPCSFTHLLLGGALRKSCKVAIWLVLWREEKASF
jgi:hypothetical protein